MACKLYTPFNINVFLAARRCEYSLVFDTNDT